MTTTTKPRKPRARDPIFEAVVEVCGLDRSAITASERGRLNKAVKELKAVDATPQDVQARATRFRRRYRDAALTPQGLTANWSTLAGGTTDADPSYWRRAH